MRELTWRDEAYYTTPNLRNNGKCGVSLMRDRVLTASCTLAPHDDSVSHRAIADEWHYVDGACKVGCPAHQTKRL